MNIVMWMLTGTVLGWIAYSYLNFNKERGIMVSLIIGALGGFIGGNVIAPLFTAGVLAAEDYRASTVFFAAAIAAAFLAAGNLIYKRWGV
jgi:uncharacterized membrane protein YeaQ/YmgE (transglycosylase-associated protein family)